MPTVTKTPKGKKQKAPKKTRAELVEEALDYRKQGYTVREIAPAMGIQMNVCADMIREGLEATQVDDRRTTAQLEIQRIQDAQKNIATNVANGEPDAIRTMRSLEKDLAEAKVRLDPEMREIFGNAALFELGKVWTTTGKRRNGRPPHQRTRETVAKVEVLVLANLSRDVIAQLMGLDRRTLDKHYGTMMDLAKAHVTGKLVGTVIEGGTRDPRLGLEILSRQGVEGFKAPIHTPQANGTGKNNSDEYDPATGAARTVIHRIEVMGGLPSGSTPEKPEGDNYSDVPPEEERK
jgi:transposase-like protein